jgi:DNA (cytosine-5)-methyltransferase 1
MALVDLFCGSGGFSLGAHRAGFDVAAAFDIDPILTSAFERNFPKTKLVLADVSKLTAKAVRANVGDVEIEGVFGGPPCQGFSDIGRRDVDDPRRQLLGHFFRLVAELQPKFFVMENVRGLNYHDARGVLDEALLLLNGDYGLYGPIILDAADFGAATKRRRLFVIGVHKDAGSPLTDDDLSGFKRPAASVRDALRDLTAASLVASDIDGFDEWRINDIGPPSRYSSSLRSPTATFSGHRIVEHRPDVAARFATVPQGGMDAVGRHPRLSWDGQCPTLRAGTGSDRGSYQAVRPLHPEVPRVITVREAARLQGFPDSHIFHPTIWHSFRMIGNSVSPVMSKAIFDAISAKLGLGVKVRLAA